MDIVGLIIVVAVTIISMVLHELAHGWTAYALGDTTAKEEGRLSLNPANHLDPYMSIILPVLLYLMGAPIFGGAKPVPVNTMRLKNQTWGMALVAIAGPLTNFILAFLAFLLGHFTGILYSESSLVSLIVNTMIRVNLGFGIFNLIPIPPLDGSRVLYAIAPDGARTVMDVIESTGTLVVLLVVMLASQPLSIFIGSAMSEILNFFYMIVGVA